jgi:hypothetical protein
MVDLIANILGTRTPYAPDGLWTGSATASFGQSSVLSRSCRLGCTSLVVGSSRASGVRDASTPRLRPHPVLDSWSSSA